jgi:thiol:disulfide interchange protein DsbD
VKKIFIVLAAIVFAIVLPEVSLTRSFAQTDTAQGLSDAEIEALLNEESKLADSAVLTAELGPSVEVSKNTDSYGDFGQPLVDCNKREDKLSVWSAFGLGILGGFAALFFPCTFPMIPMTMSFFLKGSGDAKKGTRNAILYGFAIFLVYVLLSLPFNLGLSGDALSNFSTNLWVNLVFFAIFLVFAFSLFGFYDISLPSALANKLDSKSNTGDFIGIFFMAFTLAIVSFSCTGPILGLVLGNLNNAKYITPAFAGFGLGLGLPFALFALFPNLVKNLPKSGSWLDIVKNVFGFVELAFAFKFLSNADLVMRWGLLKREPFVIIWMIVFILMALYLVGKFAFKTGYRIQPTKVTYGLAFLTLLFVGYLSTDFFGGKLSYISGFPPPKDYSVMGVKEELETHKNQYEKALAIARAEGKPLLLDFTGWACVNCRRMEENVWTNPTIHDVMKNKFVVSSLYVDEKTTLPADRQKYSETLGKQMTKEGDIWTEMQGKNFHEFTQPQYVIIDPQTGRIINKPLSGYNSVEDFKEFLECALKYKPN